MASVSPHNLSPARRLRHFGTDSDVDVPFTMLALEELPALNTEKVILEEQMPLVVADGERDALSAAHSGEADRFILHPKRESTLIVGYRAILEAARLLALTFGNTADGLYRKVCGKAESLTEIVVAQAVQGEASPLAVFSGYFQCVIAGIGERRNRILQSRGLTRRGLNLSFDCKYGIHEDRFITTEAVKRVLLRHSRGAVSNPISV